MAELALSVRRRKQPSLRRRLLALLLIPVGVLLVLDALLTYAVALAYSNRIHDHDLKDDAMSLAQLLRGDRLDGELSMQAQFLLEYDPDGRSFFSVHSRLHGLLEENASFSQIAPPSACGKPVLFDTKLRTRLLRAAIVCIHPDANPADTLTISVAETLQDRRRRAREILLLAVPLQTLLLAGVLSLVWFGVSYGLRVLDPLTDRLAAREHELTPIGDTDVPKEILPLTRTIDDLFARLRETLDLHERFIADAAHQLRTPLTGLILHVEGALASENPEALREAFRYVRHLTLRTARTSAQLLALTRAQSPMLTPTAHRPVDMAKLVPEVVSLRVPEALAADIELSFESPHGSRWIKGDHASLQELLDNLIDNTVRYAGGSHVTVTVAAGLNGGVRLSVEDDGQGVPNEFLPRLGERFFRAPDAGETGTGLGLAIVERIARRHGAAVTYHGCHPHGLRVDVQFPGLVEV